MSISSSLQECQANAYWILSASNLIFFMEFAVSWTRSFSVIPSSCRTYGMCYVLSVCAKYSIVYWIKKSSLWERLVTWASISCCQLHGFNPSSMWMSTDSWWPQIYSLCMIMLEFQWARKCWWIELRLWMLLRSIGMGTSIQQSMYTGIMFPLGYLETVMLAVLLLVTDSTLESYPW